MTLYIITVCQYLLRRHYLRFPSTTATPMLAFFNHLALDCIYFPGLPKNTTLRLRSANGDLIGDLPPHTSKLADIFVATRKIGHTLCLVSRVVARHAISGMRLFAIEAHDRHEALLVEFSLDELTILSSPSGRVQLTGSDGVLYYHTLPESVPRFLPWIFLERGIVHAAVVEQKSTPASAELKSRLENQIFANFSAHLK